MAHKKVEEYEEDRRTQSFTLSASDVVISDKELGRGSFAAVTELEYKGLKCAGKKLHSSLYEYGVTDTIRRFKEECFLMSELRHPNIVQFLGLFYEKGAPIPTIVMELLPLNLTKCLETYGILSIQISYPILRDVAVGLHYLHSRVPSIIHRDLSSNNILLTSNMTAKISDLGVARILNLTPIQASKMTQTPGTPAYMPPESMIANPTYTTSMDIYSFGILLIHVLSSQWPIPTSESVRVSPSNPHELIPVSEAQRREKYFSLIGQDHPLIDFIKKCISNNPTLRPTSAEVVSQLVSVAAKHSSSFHNTIEMHRQIEKDAEEKKFLLEQCSNKEGKMKETLGKMEEYTKAKKLLMAERDEKIENLELSYTLQVSQLELKVSSLNSELEAMKSTKDTFQSLDVQLEEKLTDCEHDLRIARAEITHLKDKIAIKDKELEKSSTELKHVSALLKTREASIEELSKQIKKVRDYLSSTVKVSMISWKRCADLPHCMAFAQATELKGKIYFGGGKSDYADPENCLFCYDPSKDDWTAVSLPYQRCTLATHANKLFSLGGRYKKNERFSYEMCNAMCIFDIERAKWKTSSVQLFEAKANGTAVNYNKHLLLFGGDIGKYTDVSYIDVYSAESNKWNRSAVQLPTGMRNFSVSLLDGIFFLIGGMCGNVSGIGFLNNAFCIKAEDLFKFDASPVPCWQSIADTPLYASASVVLSDTLLAIGGRVSKIGGDVKGSVYAYSPNMDVWIHVGELPFPRVWMSAVSLSPAEFLVIGGLNEQFEQVNTVHKATLKIIPQ